MPTRLGDGIFVPPPVLEPEPLPPVDRWDEVLVSLALLREQLASLPRPEVHVEPADLSSIVEAVMGLRSNAGPEEMADAIAKRLLPPLQEPHVVHTDDSGVMAKLVDALERLDFRMQGKAFGSSGPPNISDNPERRLGKVSGEGNLTGLATEVTLGTLASQTTLTSLLSKLAPTYKVAEGSAVITGVGGFQTVISVTPTVATVVVGFNADVVALTDVPYGYRLVVAGVTKVTETASARRNSWVPLKLSVAANTAIAVQVDHEEITDQTFRASINYSEPS